MPDKARYPSTADYLRPEFDPLPLDTNIHRFSFRLDDRVGVSDKIKNHRDFAHLRQTLNGVAIVINLPGCHPIKETYFHLLYENGQTVYVDPGYMFLVATAKPWRAIRKRS